MVPDSNPSAGRVAQVPANLGDRVQAGQVLAQLDTPQLELKLAEAEANLAGAQARLNQIKHSPTAEELAAAQQSLAAALAAYDNLLHPNANEIAGLTADLDKAQALLAQAQAAYDRVGGDGNEHAGALPQRGQLQIAWNDYLKAKSLYDARIKPSNAKVQQALAEVTSAKSQLAKLQPTADRLAEAQASVAAAQAARDLAAEQRKSAKITAPFAGTVTSLDIRAGEYVAPGAVVVRLADTSAWEIETTDLTELNIIEVHEGTPLTVTFDAIPGLELAGRISRIKQYGENRQGDIVYTVVVTPDQQDERLRWNMTAKVSIAAE